MVLADEWDVTLRGSVPTAQARRRAMEIARAMPGVESVRDRLTTPAADRSGGQPAASPGPQRAEALREHPGGLIESAWMIGRPFLDRRGARVGTVTHVWFDPARGEVKELIVDPGVADHPVRIVPWDDIDGRWRNGRMVLVTAS